MLAHSQMLRVSAEVTTTPLDARAITDRTVDPLLPAGVILLDFVDAVLTGDGPSQEGARTAVLDALGPTGLVPLPLAGPPLPAKVLCRVCEPFDWTHLPPEAADDDETVRQCYEEVLGRMQATLDDLVAEVPHPVRTRIGDALGLDRLRRALTFGGTGSDEGD